MRHIVLFLALLLSVECVAQVPDVEQLRELAESATGRRTVFVYLKKVGSSRIHWPEDKELHLKLADG